MLIDIDRAGGGITGNGKFPEEYIKVLKPYGLKHTIGKTGDYWYTIKLKTLQDLMDINKKLDNTTYGTRGLVINEPYKKDRPRITIYDGYLE